MHKLRVILVDKDDKYIQPLEAQFMTELKEQVELMVITEKDYLAEFFQKPQRVDVLLIHETMYDAFIEKQNITEIILLTEQKREECVQGKRTLYKYTSTKEIYTRAMSHLLLSGKVQEIQEKKTKTILVYSPLGGSGATTIAVGLSTILNEYGKNTLFLSTEPLQMFSSMLPTKNRMPTEVERAVMKKDQNVGQSLIHSVQQNGNFQYVPPCSAAFESQGMGKSSYQHMLQKIKEENQFDYLVMDMGSDFNEGTTMQMCEADRCLMVAKQDRYAVRKMEKFLEHVDVSNTEKFQWICNFYQSQKENRLYESKESCLKAIDIFVENMKSVEQVGIAELSAVSGLRKLAYLYL